MPQSITDRASALPALAEVFRDHGFEGASLSLISKATGLGKGSLYNFFPGGKEEMMAAVLIDIDNWFNRAIFTLLEQSRNPRQAIAAMIEQVHVYFHAGGKVCLVGLLGLATSRDPFASHIKGYFTRWISALAICLQLAEISEPQASKLAEETVAGIQGAIVLSRALDDKSAFIRIVEHQKSCLLNAIFSHN